jgi:hypothetical protein
LLCCAARASFQLKSVTVVGAKQVLTAPIQSYIPNVAKKLGHYRSSGDNASDFDVPPQSLKEALNKFSMGALLVKSG